MTIALVQHVPAVGEVASANGSVTISAAGAGNLIAVVAAINLVGASVTDPAGYTRRIAQDQSTSRTVIIIDKIAAGGETTIAFTHSSVVWDIEAFEFSGVAAAGSEYDTSIGAQDTAHTSKQPGSITPANSGEVFVGGVVLGGDNGGSEAIDSSWNIVDAASFTRMLAGYKIKTDALAENPTFSWTSSRSIAVAQAAFIASVASAVSLPDRHYPRGVHRGVHRGVA